MENQYKQLVNDQKKYFKTGATRPVTFRIDRLRKLKNAILSHEKEIGEALYKDLGKSEAEVVSTEIGFTLNEINHVMKKLPKWAKKTKNKTNLFNLPGKSFIIHEPVSYTHLTLPTN